jgi:hypothetical protein
MIIFKDLVNRSEAMRTMESLGRIIVQYRQDHGAVPPQSFIDSTRGDLEGRKRLGDVIYRARWIGFESKPGDILAYAKRNTYSLFVKDGYIILRLSGEVEWMSKSDFDELLARQQSQAEIEMLERNP